MGYPFVWVTKIVNHYLFYSDVVPIVPTVPNSSPLPAMRGQHVAVKMAEVPIDAVEGMQTVHQVNWC